MTSSHWRVIIVYSRRLCSRRLLASHAILRFVYGCEQITHVSLVTTTRLILIQKCTLKHYFILYLYGYSRAYGMKEEDYVGLQCQFLGAYVS